MLYLKAESMVVLVEFGGLGFPFNLNLILGIYSI